MYVFHLLINKSVFTVYWYLYCDEEEEGDGFEGEVCYSITHKVQFNVNCQIIS